MEFKHFSHNHGLVVHHIPSSSDQVQCNGCKLPASGSLYVCWKCRYFLHDQCFRAPRSLKHPSHPIHSLTLIPFPTYPSASFICNSCHAPGNGLSYSCSECEFDVHVHCAHLPLHPTNPNSPSLNLNPPIYPPPVQTNTFPNPYPPQTAPYPPISNPTTQNPIPQTIIPPVPVNPTTTTNPLPNSTLPNYNTVIPTSNPTPQTLVPPAPVNLSTTFNPPPPNPTVLTPNPAISQPDPPQSSQPKPPSIIRHFSHPHILKAMEINKSNAKICSACERELSGAAYCCTEPRCTFNLHKACFDSPQEVKHKSHLQHPLKLLTAPPYSDGFTCNACLKDGKAFAYTCAACSYDLHIDCIQWPDKVVRSDHKHALTLNYSSPAAGLGPGVTFTCDACKDQVHDMAWVYYCRECDFGTHLECVASAVKTDGGGAGGSGGGVGDAQAELIREFALLQLLMAQQGTGIKY